MARTETILQAFVASPSDVAEERKLLEDVVREINVTWRKNLGLSIDLLKWETHATPGAGTDPQSIINEAIGTDYDIFIGIMWGRFGTATPRHGSGTEEEFRNAHKKWESDPNSVKIMFYFNESGISPSTLDPDQIKKIQTFKSSLGNEGVLYWHYKDPGHFSQILRLHLSRILQEWGKSQQTPPPQTPATPDEPESVDREKVGLLDAMETFLDACLGLKEVSGRISDALNDVGDCMSSRAVELNALRDEHESSRLKSARRVMDKTADDIDRFTLRMRPEIKMFSEHNIKIAESSSTIASLSTEFRDSKENLANIVDGLDQLAAGMSPLTGQIGDLGNSISSLPRASVKFNQSRKAAVKVVDDLVESIDESISVVTEAKALVSQMAK